MYGLVQMGMAFIGRKGKSAIAVFKAFTAKDGLINDNVIGVWEGKDGYVWLTTNNGLSRFNPKDNTFQNYTKHDGLLSNQFYWNAIGGSKNGEVMSAVRTVFGNPFYPPCRIG